jgi:hypothetical protein
MASLSVAVGGGLAACFRAGARRDRVGGSRKSHQVVGKRFGGGADAIRRRVPMPPARAFLGGGAGQDPLEELGLRAPLPFPQCLAVGLSCAIDGSKAAFASPSDAWKPLTGATLLFTIALDGVGFYASSIFLHAGPDAGFLTTVITNVALVVVDGAWYGLADVTRRVVQSPSDLVR